MNTDDIVFVNGIEGQVLMTYPDGGALIRFRADQTPEEFRLFGPEVYTRKHEASEITLKRGA